MVLQDSTTDPPTSDPLSDPDPYGDPEENQTSGFLTSGSYHVGQVPTPNALFGAISGINITSIGAACSAHVKSAAQDLQRLPTPRLPTQTEAEALSYHCAAGLVTASYGKPLGYTIGLYRAYSTRKTYRFPFHTPNPKTFDPTLFSVLGRPIFKGQQARVAWHGLRCSSYGVGMAYVGHLLFGVWGMWKMIVGESTDDRLKEVFQARTAAAKSKLNGMKAAGSIDGKDAGEVLRRSREEQAQQRKQRHDVERKQTAASPDWDDASPSAAGWDDVSEPITEDPSPDAYTRKRIPVRPPLANETKHQAQQRADKEQYGTSADSLLSDLSTPSSDTASSPPSTGKASSGESAWARVRRENTSSDSNSDS